MKNKVTVSIAGQDYTMVSADSESYVRKVAASENLRRQVKDGLEENAKLKAELSECKREIFKLQNKK